jgi:NAD/NADP transhydrogenase beta subunit
MNKHTPAPWTVVGGNVYGNGLRSILPAKGADAVLMAAAPEMLAALIDLIGIAQEAVAVREQSEDEYDRDTALLFQADIDRARAVIAKARGEEQ